MIASLGGLTPHAVLIYGCLGLQVIPPPKEIPILSGTRLGLSFHSHCTLSPAQSVLSEHVFN